MKPTESIGDACTSPAQRLPIAVARMKLLRASFGFVARPCRAYRILAALVAMSLIFASGMVLAASRERLAGSGCCRVIELRQYFLKPGQRDVLIRLFDREFVETQEADGMHILGQFGDEDDPDRFVWIRGFADMRARKRGLAAFYSGPAWKKFGKQAAATMIDSDDVLLLRPVDPADGFDDIPATRPAVGATTPPAFVIATIYHLRPHMQAAFPDFFRTVLRPALRIAGVVPRATFETEHAQNNYPALPIREGEDVFVWFASYESPQTYADALDRLARSPSWNGAQSGLQAYLDAPLHVLRLRPTGRSLLH